MSIRERCEPAAELTYLGAGRVERRKLLDSFFVATGAIRTSCSAPAPGEARYDLALSPSAISELRPESNGPAGLAEASALVNQLGPSQWLGRPGSRCALPPRPDYQNIGSPSELVEITTVSAPPCSLA